MLTEQFRSGLTSETGVETSFKPSPGSFFPPLDTSCSCQLFNKPFLVLPEQDCCVGTTPFSLVRKCHDSEIWFCSEVEEHTNKHKIIIIFFFFFLPKASCKSQSEWSVLKTELLHPGWDLSRFDRNIFKAGKQKLIQRGQNVLFWFLICKEDGSKMDGFSRQVCMSKKGHLGIKSIPPPLCFHSVAVPYGELWIISG